MATAFLAVWKATWPAMNNLYIVHKMAASYAFHCLQFDTSFPHTEKN
jgi:hypothetical protein